MQNWTCSELPVQSVNKQYNKYPTWDRIYLKSANIICIEKNLKLICLHRFVNPNTKL